jgi:hypothetical protein
MFRGMPVLGIVAAADMAAVSAQPQMNPGIAGLHAFLATAGVHLARQDRI